MTLDRCSCGNAFDGDNLCMESACQWEGLDPLADAVAELRDLLPLWQDREAAANHSHLQTLLSILELVYAADFQNAGISPGMVTTDDLRMVATDAVKRMTSHKETA